MTASIHPAALHATFRPQPRSVMSSIRQVFAVAHQRRQLRALDEHLLEDIGISRAQALEEGRQTAWSAPIHWLK